jgi:beta-1,4-N-acetylglucosaminyltransferase
MLWLWCMAVLVSIGLFRLWAIIPWKKQPLSQRKGAHRTDKVKTMIVLGSGGHTAEMLKLLTSLDLERYTPRCYVIAATDNHSMTKMEQFESAHNRSHFSDNTKSGTKKLEEKMKEAQKVKGLETDWTNVRAVVIPRSREVGQSYISSVWTTLVALKQALAVVFYHRPNLLLCNGPGTCVPICAAAYLLKFLGLKDVRIIYVESIARVETLSLSGKILYYLANHFLVQWPQLRNKYRHAEYIGRLC